MPESVLTEIARLRRMDVADLRAEWERLFGEPARSSNKEHLFRRCAWKVQELAHGGPGDLDLARLEELGQDAIEAAASRNRAAQDANPPPAKPRVARIRDTRRPTPGTVLTRIYHGEEIRVVTLEDGFEYAGRVYGSLSAVARAITGQKWNGLLFFGLTDRKRRR